MSDLPDSILDGEVLVTHNCQIIIEGKLLTVQTDLSKIIGIPTVGSVLIASVNKIVDFGNKKYFVSFTVTEQKREKHENFTKRRLAHKGDISRKPMR